MIISICNIKGGVAKTTTAIALATAAARKGENVVVIDTDPQSSASMWAYDAEAAGKPLEFEVMSGNLATLERVSKRKGAEYKHVFIDTPPSGAVADKALEIADLVVIPVAPAAGETAKTWETMKAAVSNGKDYAVLINRVNVKTLSFKDLVATFEERNVSYFDTYIPAREALRNAFGQRMGDLYGYEEVLEEIESDVDDGRE